MISGTAKGTRLKTQKGMTTRPTSDMVKEGLFNIIAQYVQGAQVLDLFAGTGSLGIEALSRGADCCRFVDKSQSCCRLISENLKLTRLADKAIIDNSDVFFAIERLGYSGTKFDIILLDPPYYKNIIGPTLNYISKNDIIRTGGLVIAERNKNDPVVPDNGSLVIFRERRYGDTSLDIYLKQN